MPFFEFKQELYLIICFVVIPAIAFLLVYKFSVLKVILLPVIIMGLFMFVSFLFYPYIFNDIYNSDYDSTTIYWLVIFIPLNLLESFVLMFIIYLIKRRVKVSYDNCNPKNKSLEK